MRHPRPMRQGLWACLVLLAVQAIAPVFAPASAQTTSPEITPDQNTGRAMDPATKDAPEEWFEQGERYHAGQGVIRDFRTAADFYRQAAQQGHAGAQNRLGQYYHSGLGVAQDLDQALTWLEQAAQQGDPQHLFDLATALEGSDPTRAAAIYEQAADAGHTEASVNLGVLYQDGIGVAQDHERAFALYFKAAKTGHARARNNLGLLYVRGHGVDQHYEKATVLFQAAADQGLPTAMRNLSVMYANGLGIAQSDALAEQWARRASQTRQDVVSVDDTELCLFDDRLQRPDNTPDNRAIALQAAQSRDPVTLFLAGWLSCSHPEASILDLRQAARLFRAAADRGHGPSMLNLAQFYIQGRGVPQDFMLGYMWLTLAGSAGLPQTLAQSTALQQRMPPEQVNEAQTRAREIWRKLQPM